MVSKASDDCPEPESPVKTTSLSRGMVRSMSLRLCSRAPLITISVCCRDLLPAAFLSATDAGPHPAGLRLAPPARLGGGRRRQGLPVLHRVATKPDEPVAQFRRPLELQVASRLLPLAVEILGQALDLVRRQPGRQRGDRFLDRFLLVLLEVVAGLDDGGRCDPVLLVIGNLDIATAVGLV